MMDRSVRTDRTRRLATVATQPPGRGDNPRSFGTRQRERRWIVPSEPIEPEDSQQSLLSHPGQRGQSPQLREGAA
ncbi:MAG UNVERIFIED_CONTAM: hypothetical protein LVR18_52255 [Planctomycetaceae bacterium]